ncbi:MAG: PQQ-binding-like beta-propeller repeat protein [Chitinispirillaceae bacterium]|nr:PQQ-binding-like beta-propeller repeat protein [Chitinispirillaceae bacterium]
MKLYKLINISVITGLFFHVGLFAEPVLLKTVNITSAGTGKRMLLGDVTGDGRLEMVMMQGNQMADDRYIGHEVNCLTVFDCDGRQLWQVGNPAGGAATGSDIPAQVYDIDRDGFNEVLACMNGKLRILNGKDGTEKSSFNYPNPDAHDCIVIANLTGREKPQDIILKDRYNQIWAMDRTGKQLWTYAGNTGHYPWPFDFDGDGKDEVFCGFDFLSSEGKKQWSMNQDGHADCIWVGDVDQDPSNGTEIAVGGADVTVYHQDGTLMWRNALPQEPQNIAIGDFLPDEPGLEIGGQDRVLRDDPGEEAIFVFSSTGETTYYKKRSGWGSIAYMCHNWEGDGADHLMIWRGPDRPALYNGSVEQIASFTEGYMMAGDMNGDGSDEIVIFTETNASIYSNGQADLSKAAAGCPAPRPQQKRHYCFTRYWGGEYTKENFTTAVGKPGAAGKTSHHELRKPFTLSIAPGRVRIDLADERFLTGSFALFDVQGRTVTAFKNTGKRNVSLTIYGYNSGVLVLRVSADGTQFSETVVF